MGECMSNDEAPVGTSNESVAMLQNLGYVEAGRYDNVSDPRLLTLWHNKEGIDRVCFRVHGQYVLMIKLCEEAPFENHQC